MRIGLFMSEEQGAVGEILDLESLAGRYPQLDVVAVYEDFTAASNRNKLLSEIIENKLEGIILAGPSPKYYERNLSGKLFVDSIEKAGVNTNKISYANLREQVAFPHSRDKKNATIKAKALIDIAVEKIELRHPIEMVEVAPRKSVAIIGATAGAIVAARRFLEQGFKVHIFEKESDISNMQRYGDAITLTQGYVETHPKAFFHFDSKIADVYGWCGDYTIELNGNNQKDNIHVGGIVIAVGNDRNWIAQLQPLVQIDTDDDGFFRTVDPLTLPVQTTDEGKVVIPYQAETPESLGLEIARADSAALSLQVALNRREIIHHVTVSEVNESLCGACGTCVRTCAFRATSIDLVRSVSVIDPRRCRGCGNCVVACPTEARDLVTYPNKYLLKAIRILGETPRQETAKILAILCDGCGYGAADKAGLLATAPGGQGYPASIMPLRIECGGRVDCEYILYAFNCGFDGAIIFKCRRGHCHNIIGNRDMDGRISLFRAVLRSLEIDTERLRVVDISPQEGKFFAQEINEFEKEVRERVGGMSKCIK
jgi:heterodisulfide reductase subunit A-like polyferredoxin/coenzyme F420-reducing hydrogenase delta subunit